MARPLAKLAVAALLAVNATFDTGCTAQEMQAAARIIPQVAQVATQVLNTAAQSQGQNRGNTGPAAPRATNNNLGQLGTNTGFQAGNREPAPTLK